MLSARRLANVTKALIIKCGGLEEASQACADLARPYSVTQLSRCQTPGSGCFLPIDIVAALESYCGEPVVSKAMVEARPSLPQIADLMTEASETTEAAAGFQSKVRRAIADGHVDAAEQVELEREADALFEQARESREAVQKLRVPS